MSPDLSVIIFTRNDAHHLQGCIGTFIAEPPPMEVEVIVFDNASTDDTGATLDFLGTALPLQPLRTDVETSFSIGNNEGLKVARGRHVLFLNPDTVPRAEVLARCLAVAERGDVGLVGPRLRHPDGADQENGWALPTLGQRLRQRLGAPKEIVPSGGGETDVGWLMGCFLLGRRTTLERVGGFDPRFWFHGTDLELCARVGKEGRIVRVDDVELIHVGHQRWDTERRRKSRAATLQWIRRDRGRVEAAAAAALARLADAVEDDEGNLG